MVDVTQILGRILRKPHQHHFTQHNGLKLAYVLTASSKFQDVLTGIVSGLNQAGFSDHDYRVLPTVAPVEPVVQPKPMQQLILDERPPLLPTPAQPASGGQDGQSDGDSALTDSTTWTAPTVDPDFSGYYAQGLQTLQQAEQSLTAEVDPDLAAVNQPNASPIIPKGVEVVERVATIKPTFKESAETVVLPQFFWAASQGDYADLLTDQDEKGLIFDYNNLLGEADLRHAPVDIDFKKVLSQLQLIDIEELSDERQEYQVSMQRLSAERKKREDAAILGKTLPSQQHSVLQRLTPRSLLGIVLQFEKVAAQQQTLPSLKVLFGSLISCEKPSYHPEHEADTQVALDDLATSPAARAAAQTTTSAACV